MVILSIYNSQALISAVHENVEIVTRSVVTSVE